MKNHSHSLNLWQNFKSALKNQLEKDNDKVDGSFKLAANRKYYFKESFKKIAETLNLVYKSNEEFLRVDYAFFKKGSKYGWRVPQILVESENNYNTIYQEILKLCSLNAPLKVLISYIDLENKKIKKMFDEEDHDWKYIFGDFISDSVLIGHTAIIFMKLKNGNLRVDALVYNNQGELVEQIW